MLVSLVNVSYRNLKKKTLKIKSQREVNDKRYGIYTFVIQNSTCFVIATFPVC